MKADTRNLWDGMYALTFRQLPDVDGVYTHSELKEILAEYQEAVSYLEFAVNATSN